MKKSFLLGCLGMTLLAGITSGCGGGSSPAAPSPVTNGRATVRIIWPERGTSRLIPAGSNAIRVVFRAGAAEVANRVIPRPTEGNQTSTTFTDLPNGEVSVQSLALPNANGTGQAQAQATQTVRITAGTTVPISLTMASTIDRVAFTPEFPTPNASTDTITATAYNAAGDVVLTRQWVWTSSNPDVIAITGNNDGTVAVTAVSSGTSTLTCRETESNRTFSRNWDVTVRNY